MWYPTKNVGLQPWASRRRYIKNNLEGELKFQVQGLERDNACEARTPELHDGDISKKNLEWELKFQVGLGKDEASRLIHKLCSGHLPKNNL